MNIFIIKKSAKKESKFKVGNWYTTDGKGAINYQGGSSGFGFSGNVWNDLKDIWSFQSRPELWKPADKEKVKELLRKEAERRYPEGIKVKDLSTGRIDVVNNIIKRYILLEEEIIWSPEMFFSTVIFNEGKWAEVIEKPIFKDNNGKYWYKSDIKEKDVFYTTANNGDRCIFRVKENTDITQSFIPYSIIRGNKFDNFATRFPTKYIGNIRRATEEEIQWLKRCERENKLVPRTALEHLTSIGFDIGDRVIWDNGKTKIEETIKHVYYFANRDLCVRLNEKFNSCDVRYLRRAEDIVEIKSNKYSIGDRVKVVEIGNVYPTYKDAFRKLGFLDKIENDNVKEGEIGVIFNTIIHKSTGKLMLALNMQKGDQLLIGPKGVEKIENTEIDLSNVNRVEVIGDFGIECVKYNVENCSIKLQDGGKTLYLQMIFNTKYDIGDTVFYMKDNKVCKSEIDFIEIREFREEFREGKKIARVI